MTGQFLDPPINLLQVGDRDEWTFRIYEVEWGDVILPPRTGFSSGVARCLRLHLPEGNEPDDPPWWDVTSHQLQAALEPLLPWVIERRRRLRIRPLGTPPRVSYSVDVIP